MSRTLTLLLPHDSAAVSQRLPALETLLARGERRCDQSASWPHRLLQLCNLMPATDQELPLGALCALGDGLAADEGLWLRAEPVHLVADQDKVYLAARATDLAMTADEAAALAAEFNALFHDDGWQLLTPTPERWYLRLPQPWRLHTYAPDNALGCDVHPFLPQGADGLRLLAALSEIQMLFHASDVNAHRVVLGRPAINSLWLWGSGALPSLPALPWQRMQGDDCLLRGIAALGQAACETVVGDAAAWLRGEGSGLVCFDIEAHPLPALETQWFAPMLAALHKGSIARIDIHLTNTPCRCQLDARAARRWWRRRRPLADYTQ